MKRNLIQAIGILGLAALGGLGMVHVADAESGPSGTYTPPSETTLLSCSFREEGPKGDCRDCTATFEAGLARGTEALSPNNTFTVICDGHTVYAAGGFTQGAEVGGNPDFGISIVTAIPNIQPNYPAVWVDGDFLDIAHSFHDVDSRLRLSAHDVLFGRCDHEAILPPPATR